VLLARVAELVMDTRTCGFRRAFGGGVRECRRSSESAGNWFAPKNWRETCSPDGAAGDRAAGSACRKPRPTTPQGGQAAARRPWPEPCRPHGLNRSSGPEFRTRPVQNSALFHVARHAYLIRAHRPVYCESIVRSGPGISRQTCRLVPGRPPWRCWPAPLHCGPRSWRPHPAYSA